MELQLAEPIITVAPYVGSTSGAWRSSDEAVIVGNFCIVDPADGFVKFLGKAQIGDHCIVDGSGGVVIGDGVQICAGARVVSSDVRPGDPPEPYYSRVTIGARAYIGVGAILLPGASVGDDAVVAPGSVVMGAVPAKGFAAPPTAQVFTEGDEQEQERVSPEAPASNEPKMPDLLGCDS